MISELRISKYDRKCVLCGDYTSLVDIYSDEHICSSCYLIADTMDTFRVTKILK